MSYVALYRKWRPRTFDEVRGQDAVCRTLKNQIMSGRVGHAYLFCGTRGTGKTSIAKIMARAVNCESPSGGNPCGVCAQCRSILEESSMNVVEIDAASNNGVDNIRDIREQVQYPPTEGKYRVFIIDEVHMLSAGAFNALLKTLEEPPSYVIFILATTEVHKIPVTVLSRCQRYDFHRITADVIASRLRELSDAEKIDIEDRALDYIARAADGAMRDALSLLDECIAFHPEERISYDQVLEILGAVDVATFAELFAAVSGGNAGEALRILDREFVRGREMGQFVNDFLWYLRNLLILKTAGNGERLVDSSGEKLERMRQDAAGASRAALVRYIRVLSELSNRLRYASQKRVMTELALIRLTSPEMDDENDALLERISALERELKNLKAGGIVVSSAQNSGQGAAGAGEDVKKPAVQTGPRTVALPRAEYEDLQAIRSEWGRITEAAGGMYAAALRGTTVEPAGSGTMCIVFPGTGAMRFGGKEAALEALTSYIRETWGKEIAFRTRVRQGGQEETTNYTVTDEELKELVHFPVERETRPQ